MWGPASSVASCPRQWPTPAPTEVSVTPPGGLCAPGGYPEWSPCCKLRVAGCRSSLSPRATELAQLGFHFNLPWLLPGGLGRPPPAGPAPAGVYPSWRFPKANPESKYTVLPAC